MKVRHMRALGPVGVSVPELRMARRVLEESCPVHVEFQLLGQVLKSAISSLLS